MEIDTMLHLDHPNVLKLYETFEDADSVYLVLEFNHYKIIIYNIQTIVFFLFKKNKYNL